MASYDYVTDTGVIVADTQEVRTEVEDEQKVIFGDDFDVSDATPQGVQINAEAESRRSVIRNNVQLANQINPNIAGGIALNAIWALTGGERNEGTKSVVEITCFGVDGTLIAAGRNIRDEAGVLWSNLAAATIGAIDTGEVVISFYPPEVGATTAAPGTITTIVDGADGWNTCTNVDAAQVGTLTTSDAEARRQRRDQLGLQGIAATTAMRARVSAVDGVNSLAIFDNDTPNDITFEGVLIAKNSVYVCVDGGGNSEIGAALFESKTFGAGYTGDISIPIINGSNPNPYIAKFSKSTEIPIFVEIDIRLSNAAIVDPSRIVKEAMITYANGELSPEPGFVAGADASPFELAGAVQQLVPGVFTLGIRIGTSAGPTNTDVIPIAINQVATLDENNIAVNIT